MAKVVTINFVVNDDITPYEVAARLRNLYPRIALEYIQPEGAPYQRYDVDGRDSAILNMSIYADDEGPNGEG